MVAESRYPCGCDAMQSTLCHPGGNWCRPRPDFREYHHIPRLDSLSLRLSRGVDGSNVPSRWVVGVGPEYSICRRENRGFFFGNQMLRSYGRISDLMFPYLTCCDSRQPGHGMSVETCCPRRPLGWLQAPLTWAQGETNGIGMDICELHVWGRRSRGGSSLVVPRAFRLRLPSSQARIATSAAAFLRVAR